MPVLSHLVNGKVFDIYGVALAGATVTLTHDSITPSISETTDSNGQYIINLGKLSSQWSKGEGLTITASKSAEGTKTETTTITGTGGQTVNITLAETSDFTYEIKTSNLDRWPLSLIIPLHYDGEKVTRERPFPVLDEDALHKYRASDMGISGDVRYYGFIDRFGNWYIRKDDLSDTNNRTYRYTKGLSNYPTNWTNRTSLEYDYFHNVF